MRGCLREVCLQLVVELLGDVLIQCIVGLLGIG
jgi:hypothetical protein